MTNHLTGQAYSKTVHRRALRLKLNDRTDASVEFKHRNISAVMPALSHPWLPGYRPASSYRALLFEVVADRMAVNVLLNDAILNAIERPAIAPLTPDFARLLVDPPRRTTDSPKTEERTSSRIAAECLASLAIQVWLQRNSFVSPGHARENRLTFPGCDRLRLPRVMERNRMKIRIRFFARRSPRRLWSFALARVLGLACATLIAVPVAAGPAWLQYVASGRLAARTVVERDCPKINVDGHESTMSSRGTPPPGQMPVCEADVSGARLVTIAGTPLNVGHGGTHERIVVIGDTGCRIKTEPASGGDTDDDDDDDEGSGKAKVQACNDETKWPFENVARSAAAAMPDLVIHVGDYVYREAPCPPEFARECGNSPSGDQWSTWNADFFTPARPLLASAPWIFVRGNHEICKRSGNGWFYYFGPGPYESEHPCIDAVAAYPLRIGNFQGLVVDSSNAPDSDPTPEQVDPFVHQFRAAVDDNHLSHAWLLTHRPIWAAKAGVKGDRAELRTLNLTLERAWAHQPIDGIDLVVSGHTHLFEIANLGPPLPLQIVVGNGGTKLAHQIKVPLAGQKIGTAIVAQGIEEDDFGFVLLEPKKSGDRWTLKLRDNRGNPALNCSVARSQVECRSP